MPGPRKVNSQQMDILLNFVEQNREVGLGRHPGGPYGAIMVRQAWQNLAQQLNSVDDGCKKAPEQWRRYWIEFKAKTRSKAADSRRSALNGEKASRLVPLTQHEERALVLSGNSQVSDDTKAKTEEEEDDDCEDNERIVPRASPYPDPLQIHKERKHRRNHYRPMRPEDKAPAWVLRHEERRIAAEERLATALEALTASMDERLAALTASVDERLAAITDVLQQNLSNIANRLPR